MRLKVMMLLGVLCLTILNPTGSAATVQINDGNDDADERGDGTFTVTGTTIDIYSHTDDANTNYRCGGFRFENIRLETGDNVDNASIELYISNQNDINAFIFAENADNSVDFVANANIIDNAQRPKTENWIEWVENNLSINSWDNSDNIAGMIMEVISRPGWEIGNTITIFFISKTDQNLTANARSYDFNPAIAARLHYTFQPTIGVTESPIVVSPKTVFNVRQLLNSNGTGITGISAQINFSDNGFYFIENTPENDTGILNCPVDGCVHAEWFVAAPENAGTYSFNVTWGFTNQVSNELTSDNFTIAVTYGSGAAASHGDSNAIALVACGVAALGTAIALIKYRETDEEDD